MLIIDDEPEFVRLQIGRTKYITDRIIFDAKDDTMDILEYLQQDVQPVKPGVPVEHLNVFLSDNDYGAFMTHVGRGTGRGNPKFP